jgi:peptidoglycan-associated lipoprotein
LALVSLLALGCGSDPAPPPETSSDAANANAATTTAQGNEDGDGDGPMGVGVDERIAKMCSLPEARFDFDSASVSASAKSVLDAIAACFVSGPGKDKGMNIVGHADPRGPTTYNFGLGQRRAGSVAKYLTTAGVTETRIETSSRGELEASGGDESGWAKDRKVEILLAE